MLGNIENLVFEGGGVRGVAYVGVLDGLNNFSFDLSKIKRVGGTSAGAIMALLLGLNYSRDEIKDIFREMDFSKFKDNTNPVVDLWRITNEFGYCKGEYFFHWIEQFIEKKTGNRRATFADVNA